jgi:hypothetical protein
MTTLIPREKYTADELSRLYPQELALQQVQVVRMRISSLTKYPYSFYLAPQTRCAYLAF